MNSLAESLEGETGHSLVAGGFVKTSEKGIENITKSL